MELIFEPSQNLGERPFPAPVHDYDNLLKLFYSDGPDLMKQEAETPMGIFDELVFGNDAVVHNSHDHELLKVNRLLKDRYWFTYVDDGNVWIAPWPHFDPLRMGFKIWVNQYGTWYGNTKIFANQHKKWYEGTVFLNEEQEWTKEND